MSNHLGFLSTVEKGLKVIVVLSAIMPLERKINMVKKKFEQFSEMISHLRSDGFVREK